MAKLSLFLIFKGVYFRNRAMIMVKPKEWRVRPQSGQTNPGCYATNNFLL
jgi:hypothetical protein